MSRIGKSPVAVPAGVEVAIAIEFALVDAAEDHQLGIPAAYFGDIVARGDFEWRENIDPGFDKHWQQHVIIAVAINHEAGDAERSGLGDKITVIRQHELLEECRRNERTVLEGHVFPDNKAINAHRLRHALKHPGV